MFRLFLIRPAGCGASRVRSGLKPGLQSRLSPFAFAVAAAALIPEIKVLHLELQFWGSRGAS